jgi:hypothetical protein
MKEKKAIAINGTKAVKIYSSSSPVKKTGGCGCGKSTKKQ